MEICNSEKPTMSEQRDKITIAGNNKRQKRPPIHDDDDDEDGKKRDFFCINDHVDVVVEILRRLDGPSLCSATCVCRLWSTVARNDSIWEDLCFRHVYPPPSTALRSVVSSLGGFRRLYFVCVRPLLRCLRSPPAVVLSNRDQLQLALSLFSVDYYERLCVGAWLSDSISPPPSSLAFLRKPVNVI